MRHLLVAALLPIAATAQTPCRTPLGVPCHTIRFQQTQWSLFRSGISDVQRFRTDRLSAVRGDGSALSIINSDQFTLTGGRQIGKTQVSMYLAPTDQLIVIDHDEKLISIREAHLAVVSPRFGRTVWSRPRRRKSSANAVNGIFFGLWRETHRRL